MRGAPAIPNRLLGALRYGASSSAGPDAAAKYLDMSPGELSGLKCLDFYKDREIILAAKSQFTEAQLSALRARALECTGSRDPGLITEVIGDAPGELAADAVQSALGATGLLGGVADVIGNALLALAGLGLVVIGLTRVFGVSVGPLRSSGGR